MPTDNRSREELLSENADLRLRLEEVDKPFVSLPEGQQIFTLKGAEHSYRVLVETIKAGAAFISPDGMILYCNKPLSELLQMPMEKLIGTPFAAYVASEDLVFLADLLDEAAIAAENQDTTNLLSLRLFRKKLENKP